MATVRHLGYYFFCNICRKFKFAYLYADVQNLVKIGQSELLRIFDFQNGDRPPYWIFLFSQYLSKIQIKSDC